MPNYEFFLCSSLEKVFPNRRPPALPAASTLSAWGGTRAAVQLVYRAPDVPDYMPHQDFRLEITGGPCPCTLRKVELIPSEFPCYGYRDAHYITDQPGLFPDLLAPYTDAALLPVPGQYRSLWLSWELPQDVPAGSYPITVQAKAVEEKILPNGVPFAKPEAAGLCFTCQFTLRVSHARMPAQRLIHTEWFHADCLANYYGTETFDERHWQIIENFIEAAACRHGVNMLLTPVFTPPLDTARGGERRTVQLVDVARQAGVYTFDFAKLRRWAGICRRYGVRYLEMAHFFTQWGATSAPKVMAVVDGSFRQLFGWDTCATAPEYAGFLRALLPQLQQVLTEEGYDKAHVYYHISDEPSLPQLASYQAARDLVKDLIPESQIIDALSSLDFYKQGIVPHPIPGTTEIDAFHQENIPGLWVYYCCAQCVEVPNRFFSMESARNRIMGVLLYLYNIEGFLHWGYNFYNAKFSLRPIDPYRNTHADFGYPSGDAFLVYPGPDGQPLDSLRVEVQDEGLTDLRALQLLESLTDRSFVEELIYQDAPMRPMRFAAYPRDAQWILDLRERVATEIDRHI